jgi:hypothetical protein
MKKLFAILAVASVMTACNNAGDAKTEEKKDTTAAGVAADAQKMADSASSKMQTMADSASSKMQTMADSASSKMKTIADSASSKMKDAGNKMKEAVKH